MPGGVSTSSLIGVAIACVGNVLISLALTLQKLAHRRQSERYHSEQSRLRAGGDGGVVDLSHEEEEEEDIDGQDDVAGPGREAAVVPVVVLRPGEDSLSATTLTELPLHLPKARSPRPARHATPDNPDRRAGKGQGDGGSGEGVEEGMYLKSKLWWLGQLLITVGEGGNFVSYGFAPASVVAPLGTVALVANCIFAPLILRERFKLRELAGMGLAILGAVTVVYASNDSNPRLDPGQLLHALRQIPFLIYTGINILLLVLLMLLSRSPRFGQRFIAIDVGICALFGGYTVLSTKALSSLLSSVFLGVFKEPVTWGLVVVLVGTSVMQVKYLNKALMRFQSKEVIPTQFVFFSMTAIIGSAVLYQEFRDIPFSHFVNFIFGIATTFFGVYLLTSPFHQPASSSDHNDDDDEDDDHETAPPSHMSTPRPRLSPGLPAVDEYTPLLVPSSALRPTADGDLSLSPNGILLPGSMGKVRLLKRASTNDFGAALGIGSQAGLLIMAASPPPSSSSNGGMSSRPDNLRRDRSASRSGQGGGGAGAGAGGSAGRLRPGETRPGEERRSTESTRSRDLERGSGS